MTKHKRFICAAQDAFTGQFHEVSLQVYRAVQNSQHDPMFLNGHCGIIDLAAKKCLLFADGKLSTEDHENWIMFAQSHTDNGLCHAALFPKPPKPKDTHTFMVVPLDQPPDQQQEPLISEDMARKIDEFKQTLMDQILRIAADREARRKQEPQPPKTELPNLDSLGGTGFGELGFDDFRGPNGEDNWSGM